MLYFTHICVFDVVILVEMPNDAVSLPLHYLYSNLYTSAAVTPDLPRSLR